MANEAGSAVSTSGMEGRVSPVTTGQRWHAYQIGDPIEGGPGWCYFAINVGMLDDVIIRIIPVDERTTIRGKAWDRIHQLNQPNLLEQFSVVEEGGFRYEVSRVPPPTTLKEWASCRKAGYRDVELLVRQLSASLSLLHDRGVVHMNIRPTTIFVGADETEMHLVLGGLEHATLYEQKDPFPFEVDPFYAPPEAAGLTKQTPGAQLRAWDWWCLGRVIQEVVLGKHILAELLGRDLTVITPELRARAEALILEREHGQPKAGGVERMQGLDTDVSKLLRGLLASSRDGRWGFNEVQRWLTREPVVERYQLGRNDRLFQWQNRSLSVPEAAEFFSKEENWDDGETNLFELEDPQTFIHFLGLVPSYRKTREQLDQLRALSEIPAWKSLSQDVVRSVVSAATWCVLKGAKGQLLLRGKRIEVGFLRLLASSKGPVSGRPTIRAMTSPEYIQAIEKTDAEAARVLAELAGTVEDTVNQAEKHGWLLAADEKGHDRLLSFALEPDTTLRAARDKLVQQFAVSRDQALAPLFAAAQPSRSQLILLAFAEENPRQFGFITHLQWNDEQHATLRETASRLAAAIFWLRLSHLLWAGSIVYGNWLRVIVLWGALGGILWQFGPQVFHGPWAALPLGLALILRVFGVSLQRSEANRHAPGSAAWTWRSGRQQCSDEAMKSAEGLAQVTLPSLKAALAKLNSEIAALHLARPPEPIRPGNATSSWTAVVASWLVFVLLAGGGGGYRLYRGGAYTVMLSLKKLLLPEVSLGLDMSPPLKADLPTSEELFFNDFHAPPKPWSFQEPMDAPPLPVEHLVPATPDQVATALVEAQRLLQPFTRRSVNSMIAVPVPLEHDVGLMIYDGRKRTLAAHRIFVLRDLPDEPTWFSMGDQKVLFLKDEHPAK